MSIPYIDEVAADDPALHMRLNMVGAANNGDVIPNLFGPDGELVFTGQVPTPSEPYGFLSPVETALDSRMFWGYTNASIYGCPINGVSRIRVATYDEIEPTGDCAVEGFHRPLDNIPFSGDFIMFGKSGSVGVLQTSSAGTRIGGFCYDSDGTLWKVVDPSILLTDYIGTAFHCAVERVGNALVFYRDGLPRASTTITSGLPTRVTANDFVVHPNSAFYLNARACEVAMYNHSVGAPRWLVHFEASRAINDMYVQISGRSSFVINSDPPPTYAFFPYSHDWTNPLAERLSRLTQITTAKDGSEERNGKTTRTRRTLSSEVWISDPRARRQFASFLRNNQRKPVAWPITPYETELTAPITAGDTVFMLDTRWKDFDIGNRLAVYTSEFDYEVFVIADMDDVSITVADAAVSDWPIVAIAVPVLRAYLEQDIKLAGRTNEDQEATITASILVEDIVEAPNRITPYTPVYTYRGVEAFDPFEFELNDYTEPSDDDNVQQSEPLDSQTGIFRIDSDVETSRPGFGYRTQIEGLQLISKFLGWFEARAGRLSSLWVPSMQEDFTVVNIGVVANNKITITETNYNAEYALAADRVDIALVQTDGTIVFRRITAVVPSGANEVLTLNANVNAYTLTTEQVCFLRMCRLDADDVQYEWITNDYIEVSMKFREVPKEVV